MPPAVVAVNVGGRVYETTAATLAGRGGVLAVMFDPEKSWPGGSPYLTDAAGRPFIDRDGDAFAAVLAYLRTGIALVPGNVAVVQAQQELDFYFGAACAVGGVPRPPLAMTPFTAALVRERWYEGLAGEQEALKDQLRQAAIAAHMGRGDTNEPVYVTLGCSRCICEKARHVVTMNERHDVSDEHARTPLRRELERLLAWQFGGTVISVGAGHITFAFRRRRVQRMLPAKRPASGGGGDDAGGSAK